MQLLHDNITIIPDRPEEKTSSGILLSEQIKTYPPTGVVKEVAPNITEVKPGDKVWYKVYSSVDLDDNTAVVPISAIIAIL